MAVLKKILMQAAAFSAGRAAAIIINAASFPLLSLVYSPNQYGDYALTLYLASTFASVASLRLEFAIAAERRYEKVGQIFLLGLKCVLVLSLLSALVAGIFNSSRSILVATVFSGVYCSLFGVLTLISAMLVKEGKFYRAGNMAMHYSVLTVFFQVFFAWVGLGDLGLYMGACAALLFAVALPLIQRGYGKELYARVKKEKVRAYPIQLLREYSPIWKYNTGQGLVNSLSLWLLAHGVSIVGGASAVAYFSTCQKILVLPVRLVGNSLKQSLLKSLSEIESEKGRTIALKFTFILIPVVTLIFGGLAVGLPYLVDTVLPTSWRGVGEYVLPLAIWLSMTIVYVPSISFLNVQKVVWPHFAYELCVLLIRAIGIAAALIFPLSALGLVYVTSIGAAVVAVCFIIFALCYRTKRCGV